jgi:hypothetical protein|tara:strand:+ start:232 stop:639 length:408 start_codon:yes stop_codon:yes gene_type:complete
MAIYMNETVTVTVNSVDLTDHITSIDFTESVSEIETTAMGDANVTRIGGLKDGSVSISWHQDFASSEVYATLNPLLGTTTTVVVKPTSGAVSATNPSKSVSCLVTELPFVSGAVGELATFDTSWPFTGVVTTATS